MADIKLLDRAFYLIIQRFTAPAQLKRKAGHQASPASAIFLRIGDSIVSVQAHL